jgi:hypothetical protein
VTAIRWIYSIVILISAGVFALLRGDSFPDQPGLFYWLGGGKGSSVLGWMASGIGGTVKGSLSLEIVIILVMQLVVLLGGTKLPAITGLELAQKNGDTKVGC